MAQMDAYYCAEQVVERLEGTLESGVPAKAQLHKLAGMPFDGMANSATEAEMGDNMITALDNLENTAVETNNTVERLVISNKALTDSLAARDTECACLLTIITTFSTGRGASGGSSSSSNINGKPPWFPDGYCWSHGYKVRTNHSIAMCHRQREGHKDHLNAKKCDIQGGCVWNLSWKEKKAGSDNFWRAPVAEPL